MTYDKQKQCSYLKVLKTFSAQEEPNDCSSVHNNHLDEEGKTFSMIEEDAKQALITNLKTNLEHEPSV